MSPGRVDLMHDNLLLAHDSSITVPGPVLAGKASVRSADRERHHHTIQGGDQSKRNHPPAGNPPPTHCAHLAKQMKWSVTGCGLFVAVTFAPRFVTPPPGIRWSEADFSRI